MQTRWATEIRTGQTIYDVDGDKVGSVDEVYSGSMRTSTGFLGLGKDLWIPFDAVTDVRSDGIYLNVDKDDLDRMGWDKPPTTMGTTTYGRWDEEMPRYRTTWEQRYGRTGRWEDYEPAYRYGWEMRQRPEYASRRWTEAEPELRREWEVRYRDRPWTEARAPIQEIWEEPAGRPTGRTTQLEGDRTVQLREEELIPRRERVQAGEVEIHKDVVAEQRSVDVPVTREEVVVERHPVDRRPADRPIGTDTEETIRVPVSAERAGMEKRTVVAEELEVGKRRVQETERVSDTVRKEVADIETEGNVDVERGRTDRRA